MPEPVREDTDQPAAAPPGWDWQQWLKTERQAVIGKLCRDLGVDDDPEAVATVHEAWDEAMSRSVERSLARPPTEAADPESSVAELTDDLIKGIADRLGWADRPD